jgi:peptide/nickel transport system substrate-binding protein
MSPRASSSRRRTRSAAALLLSASLLLSACGGAKSDDGGTPGTGGPNGSTDDGLNVDAGESGLEEAGEPQRGGKLIYGLEGESNAGFCLSEAQLAISGMMVARAFYDTLTIPNADGGYVPYLAKAVDPNDDYTEWTIELREGIKFHDGSDLTAEVVKNNLDAYRGQYEGRASTLFLFVLKDIADVEVVDPLTVKVVMSRPWVSFPAFLYSSARLGIMAQAQLDADPATCSQKPIGTGPFEFVSWTPNQKMVGKANPDYWQIAPDGEPYPYVDEIEFRPIPDGTVRRQSIESGEINITHSSDAEQIATNFRRLRDEGKINLLVSEEQAEVSFIQMNSTIPPFNDERMRRALALGSDREDVNERVNAGLPTIATGPFAPGTLGYLDDAGFPEYLADNPGAQAGFTLLATTDPSVRRIAELIQQRAKDIGVTVTIQTVEQATLIDNAIAKTYQAMVFRNYPGGDPDQNYVWWYGEGNPVNFGGWDDPELNELFDRGRETADQAERKKIYEDINRIMASKVYGMWSWYTPWAIVMDDSVHNAFGPPLPGEDHTQPGEATTDDPARTPARGLATGHSLIGLWIEQ